MSKICFISCSLARQILNEASQFGRPGVRTQEIGDLVTRLAFEAGAYPSPLNYQRFHKSVCTAVVCHGIPDSRALEDGDIINIDITTIVDGYFGDTSEMFCVGEVSEEATRLIDVTRKSMWLGIREVAPGKRVGDIGAVIEEYAHGELGYGVVDQFCGHGIGREFHMDPHIPHVGRRRTGKRFKAGMTFTIEPMINLGTHHCITLSTCEAELYALAECAARLALGEKALEVLSDASDEDARASTDCVEARVANDADSGVLSVGGNLVVKLLEGPGGGRREP